MQKLNTVDDITAEKWQDAGKTKTIIFSNFYQNFFWIVFSISTRNGTITENWFTFLNKITTDAKNLYKYKIFIHDDFVEGGW